MQSLTRRTLLALAATAALAAQRKTPAVGIEMYSVRDELQKDVLATVSAVAGMGYQVLEFYAPYFDWTDAFAKSVRKRLDDEGVECRSTHTPARAFEAANRGRAMELNGILGSRTIVMSSAGRKIESADGWKTVAATLAQAQSKFAGAGMCAGYHNHQYEWVKLADSDGGRHAMDILAAGTPEAVTLQLDVGTCVEMKRDPVAWIRSHPGRIRSMHCKDWAPGTEEDEKGYRVLLGEGAAPWKGIFTAAEGVGGVEYYLIEQEGSRYSSLETAKRSMAIWKKLHG